MEESVVIPRFWQKERSSVRQVGQFHQYIFDLGRTGATHVAVRFDRQDLVDLVDNLEKLNWPTPEPEIALVQELRQLEEVRKAKASWQEERVKLLNQVEMATAALELLERMTRIEA